VAGRLALELVSWALLLKALPVEKTEHSSSTQQLVALQQGTPQ
jgi:hypothetical protein